MLVYSASLSAGGTCNGLLFYLLVITGHDLLVCLADHNSKSFRYIVSSILEMESIKAVTGDLIPNLLPSMHFRFTYLNIL